MVMVAGAGVAFGARVAMAAVAGVQWRRVSARKRLREGEEGEAAFYVKRTLRWKAGSWPRVAEWTDAMG